MCNSKARDFSTPLKFERTQREWRFMLGSVKIIFIRSILRKRDIVINLKQSLISPSKLILGSWWNDKGINDQKRNLYCFWGKVRGKRVSRKPPKFSVDSPGFVSGGSVKTIEKLAFQVMADLGVRGTQFTEIQASKGHGGFYSYVHGLCCQFSWLTCWWRNSHLPIED